jgi:hypothetical protein
MKHRSLLVVYLVSVAVLAGCGGGSMGGGGGSSSTMGSGPPSMQGPTPMVPIPMVPMNMSSAPGEAALVGFLQTPHQYTLRAQAMARSYSLDVASSPNPGATTFNGSAPAYGTGGKIAVMAANDPTPLASSAATAYYLTNPYAPLGNVSSTGSPYGVVATFVPFPATVTVGMSGTVDDLTYYHDSKMSTIDAEQTVDYTISAKDSASLLLCLNSTFSNVTAQGTADGLANGTQTDCYSVDAAGHAALYSSTRMVNGAMLTFH